MVLLLCLVVLGAVPVRAGVPAAAAEASLSGSDGDAERTLRGAVGAVSHQLLSRWLRANPHRDLVLHLDSPGGKALFGARLFDAIKGQGRVTTAVDEGQVCLSACTYLWLAGQQRTLAERATLGFHSSFCTAACDLRGVGLINQSLLDIVARTEPGLAVLLSRTGAMISGNTTMALARRQEGRWVVRVVQPGPG